MNNQQEFNKQLEAAVKVIMGLEPDPLYEFGALHTLISLVETRKEFLKVDAIKQSEKLLEDIQKESGEFKYKDQVFELSKTENFDFVDKPQSYANEDGAEYRKIYRERSELQTLIKSKTKLLKAISDNFKAENPKREPDSITYQMKVKKFDLKEV